MITEDEFFKSLTVNTTQSVEVSAQPESNCSNQDKEDTHLMLKDNSSNKNIDKVKKYQCSFCSQRFSEKRTVRDHENVHKGKTPYSCKECSAQFSRRTSLQLHQLVHNGTRKFKCSSCYRAFARNADLKIHQRVHTGEQPFKCEICAKTFKRKYGLNRHMRFHDDKTVFYCDLCDNTFFLTEIGLQNHLSKVHKQTIPIKMEPKT